MIFVLLIASCDWGTGTRDYNTFEYNLQGTWVSNDPSIYSGSLVIDSNQITITGYNEGQTPNGGDDSKRPFKNFTKDIPLYGYSDNGNFFIEDAGLLQEGIPYNYYTVGIYPQQKFLRFTFGGRTETLQQQ